MIALHRNSDLVRGRSPLVAPFALLILLAPCACKTPEEYRDEADEQVYALIDARRAKLFSTEEGFSIEPSADSLRQRIMRGDWTPGEPLTLVQCLGIAAENSRDYQSQRESLYLTALDLTLEQWRLSGLPFLRFSTGVSGTGLPLDSGQADLTGSAGIERQLSNGARVGATLGMGLLRAIGNGDGWDAFSSLALSFTQPLLRGSGQRIALEAITQSERNLIYDVRAFERFRRTFAVDVAERYYQILNSMDALANEQGSLVTLLQVEATNVAFHTAGRLSQIELDQAKQTVLRTRDNVLRLEMNLARDLDQFLIFLGLPVESPLSLDGTELERLVAEDDLMMLVDEEDLFSAATQERLDWLTTLDGLDDNRRRVALAADALRPGLGVSAALNSPTPNNDVLNFQTDDATWSLGLDLDLPIDMLPERNSYSRALISLQAAERNAQAALDRMHADVRQAVRSLETSRKSYHLQLGAEQLARKRVRGVLLSREAGRASTRDLLEAQDDFLAAQNTSTGALISYTITRLDTYLAAEFLRVDESGISIEEDLLRSYAGTAAEAEDSQAGAPNTGEANKGDDDE